MIKNVIKICKKCKLEKPCLEFSLNKSSKDGLQSACKSCQKLQWNKYYSLKSDKLKERARNEYIKNKGTEKHRKQDRKNSAAYLKRRTEEQINKDNLKKQNNHLLNKYGITLHDYNNMLKEQNNCCFICKNPETVPGKKLAVDHCHKTMKVRKLLCFSCNSTLGKVKEDKEILKKLIDYIDLHG